MTMQALANRNLVIGSSQRPRSLSTLLDQMADLQRGARIKELRHANHLKQPAVAERVPVTLRAYQEWEAGGGIAWENVKALAKIFGVDPDYILSGPKAETPSLPRVGQLDRIEQKLDQLLAALKTASPSDPRDQALDIAEGRTKPPAKPRPATAKKQPGQRRPKRAA